MKAPPHPNRFRQTYEVNERLMMDIIPSSGLNQSFKDKKSLVKGNKLLAEEEESTESQTSSDLQAPQSLPELCSKKVKFGETVEEGQKLSFKKQQ